MQTTSIDPVYLQLTLTGLQIKPDRSLSIEQVHLDPDKADTELALFRGLMDSVPPGTPVGSLADPKVLEPSPTISAVATEYLSEMASSGKWTPKTAAARRQSLDLLVEILGDVPVGTVSHPEARRVKDTLKGLPANKCKIPGYRGLPIPEIVAHRASPGLSAQTINKHLTTLGGFFAWAERHGYVAKNPFRGLCLPEKERAHQARDVFTEADLKAIFGATSPKGGPATWDYRHWLPILAYLTGARLEELCQLSVADVRQESGVWVLDINGRDGRRLKNRGSERLVPLHPELTRLGFVEFVDQQRRNGSERVFPELKRHRDGFGTTASKWFARRLKQLGIKAKGKCFHSFRHTFANGMKQVGQPEGQVAAILGHVEGGITYGRYGKAYQIGGLADVVGRLPGTEVLAGVPTWKP